MKAYFEIIQGTEEWHKIRWGKIGGTLARGLFVDSDTLLLDVLSEHSEDFQMDDSYQSAEMLRGTELEPLARRALSSYTGHNFLECGWLQCLELNILGISPDGVDGSGVIAAEIKCPGSKKHISTILADSIPKDNISQCIHYFTVNPKLERLYFASFRPEAIKPLFVKVLTPDTLVDIGWTVKGKVKEDRGLGLKDYVCTLPDMRPVKEWAKLARENANKLNDQINQSIEILKF